MKEQYLNWAKELQALAQAGLHYSQDVYDQERFQRIREISWEMLAQAKDVSLADIQASFATEVGYQTPKVDTRAVVWQDNRLLLVQENDGRWALPGGWMDITETVSSNAEKELMEEAGVKGQVQRVIAIHDHQIHNNARSLFAIIKIFVECDYQGGHFQANSETLAIDFFTLDSLPELNTSKTSLAQIQMCWQAKNDPDFQVEFD